MKIKIELSVVVSVITVMGFYGFCPQVNAVDNIGIITCECPPLSYEINNRAEGPGVDLVRSIQKKINTEEEINIFPWARAYQMLQDVPNTVLFSTARTPLREGLFKWVGPMAEKKYYFFAKKGSKIIINSIEDAREYEIGVHRGSNNEDYLRAKGFKSLHPVNIEKQNLMKLQFGRIDLWYVDSAVPHTLMNLYPMEGAVEEKYFVQNIKLYYAFNKNTSDSIVNNWQQALNAIRQEGTMLQIFKQHALEALYPIEY